MRHMIGKLMRRTFQIYIFLWVKNLSIFLYMALSYSQIWQKKYLNLLSYEYYQKKIIFLGVTLFYTHKSIPFDVYVKKSFFQVFSIFSSQILQLYMFFFSQKICTSNFCCSQLYPSCNISFESS